MDVIYYRGHTIAPNGPDAWPWRKNKFAMWSAPEPTLAAAKAAIDAEFAMGEPDGAHVSSPHGGPED